MSKGIITVCKHCFVSGRVQGVFYRASAAQHARELKITGYAKNLPDERVEVLACGETKAVEAFCDWLRRGPPAARVSEVVIREVECMEVPLEFTTR